MAYPSYFDPFSTQYAFRRPLASRSTLTRPQFATLLELLQQFPLPVNRLVPVAREGRDIEASQLLERAIRSGILTDTYPPELTDKGLRLRSLPPATLAALPSTIDLDSWS